MKELYLELVGSGERICLEEPVWITRNRWGLLRTRYRVKALGVSDGERVFSLGKLEGYPRARIITRAEYEEGLSQLDPELDDRQIVNILLGGGYETE